MEPTKNIKAISTTASDSTGVTNGTNAKIGKRTFVTGALLSVTKDVSSTSIGSNIVVTLKEGGSTIICRLVYEPTTAGSQSIFVSFNEPLELLENSSLIRVENSSATASIDACGIVYYYEIDYK